jgi:hypothetical protein
MSLHSVYYGLILSKYLPCKIQIIENIPVMAAFVSAPGHGANPKTVYYIAQLFPYNLPVMKLLMNRSARAVPQNSYDLFDAAFLIWKVFYERELYSGTQRFWTMGGVQPSLSPFAAPDVQDIRTVQ